jgi:hypothetical protein
MVVLGGAGSARAVIHGLGRPDSHEWGGGRWFATRLSRIGAPPALCAGARMALVRRSRGSAAPVRATLVAAVLAVGVAVAAATFAASLHHLLRTPSLYGQTWDFETDWGSIPPQVVGRLRRDPGISALALGAVAPVEVGKREVGARATDDVKASIGVPVLEGRAPRRPGEALLGPKTLDSLHKAVGDKVVVNSGPRRVSLLIVGRGILPTTKWNNLGEGIAMSYRSFKRIEPKAQTGVAEIRFTNGPERRAAERRVVAIFDGTAAVRPTEVGDFAGVNGMPIIIAALFAGAGIAMLGHALVISVRRRRRDLAILKTLGFTRGQVAAAVAWQATTVASIGVLLGAPLGVLVGRFGWNQFAEQLGVVPAAVTPIGVTLLVAPVTILIANAIAALPGRAAARTRPAVVLRSE